MQTVCTFTDGALVQHQKWDGKESTITRKLKDDGKMVVVSLAALGSHKSSEPSLVIGFLTREGESREENTQRNKLEKTRALVTEAVLVGTEKGWDSQDVAGTVSCCTEALP